MHKTRRNWRAEYEIDFPRLFTLKNLVFSFFQDLFLLLDDKILQPKPLVVFFSPLFQSKILLSNTRFVNHGKILDTHTNIFIENDLIISISLIWYLLIVNLIPSFLVLNHRKVLLLCNNGNKVKGFTLQTSFLQDLRD